MSLRWARKAASIVLSLAMLSQGAFAASQAKRPAAPLRVVPVKPAKGKAAVPQIPRRLESSRAAERSVEKPKAAGPGVREELRDAAAAPELESAQTTDDQSHSLAARPFESVRRGKDGAVFPVSAFPAAGRSVLQQAGRDRRAGKKAVAPPKIPSLARSLRSGLIGGVLMESASMAPILAAMAAGYHFHFNYHPPNVAGFLAAHSSPLQTGAYGTSLLGLVPTAEEVIFRAGIMGAVGAAMAAAGIGKSPARSFWIPAAVSAAIFVAAHETADPVMMAARFLGSMVLARVYYQEGLAASVTAHFFYNLPLVAYSLAKAGVGGDAAFYTSLAIVSGEAAGFSVAVMKLLRGGLDGPLRRTVPYALTPRAAAILALLLVAGTLIVPLKLLGLIIWHGAAVGLLAYAAGFVFPRRTGKS